MAEIREIHSGSTNLAVPALQSLRPHLDTIEVVQTIDDLLRPAGYRLIGVFNDGQDSSAQAIAGFRVTYALVRGRHLVIDEMATLPAATPANLWTGSSARDSERAAPRSTSTQQ